jgi:hypothetical protein
MEGPLLVDGEISRPGFLLESRKLSLKTLSGDEQKEERRTDA